MSFDSFSWFLPPTSGVADASMRVAMKMTSVHRFMLVGLGYLFALPYYIIWLSLEGIPEIQPEFWVVIAVWVPLLALANILMVEAHRASPFTLTVPYLALTPAFLLITSPLMGGGDPTRIGQLCIVGLVLGLYIININQSEQDVRKRVTLLSPFRALWKERGSRFMLYVAVIFAITANLDYRGFAAASGPFYVVVGQSLVGVLCIVVALCYWSLGLVSKKEISPAGSWRGLWLYGFIISLSVIPQMLSFVWIPNVPYVIAGKRTGTILASIGSLKRFKDQYARERENLAWRIPGVLLVTASMVGIIGWGK